MQGPAGAPAQKRKRKKQSQLQRAAHSVGTARTGQASGVDPGRRRPQFVIGDERPAPSSQFQLVGLDDQQRGVALAALEKFGLVHFTDVTLPLDFLAVLQSRAYELSTQIEGALARQGIQYQHRSAHSDAARAIEDNHSFKFKEVASRCLGRLDIRYGMQSKPFSDGLLTHNPCWR
jgi:hypothetical protein